MGFVRMAQCNKCGRFAPNHNRIPQQWVEIQNGHTGSTYHFCNVCVYEMVAKEWGISAPIPRNIVN